MLNHFTYSPITQDVYNALLDYARGGGAWTGNDTQLNNKGAGLARLIVASSDVPSSAEGRAMRFTRRQFVKGGVSAFTVGFAAPQFFTDLALAQSAPNRNLVVLYLARRQRRAQHAHSLSRRGVLHAGGRRWRSPPATCCRSGPIRRASSSACTRD